jgi:hypothetical protein
VTGRDHLPAGGQHRADRDAAGVQADPSLLQGERHHLVIASDR